jgi:hypothetical protein
MYGSDSLSDLSLRFILVTGNLLQKCRWLAEREKKSEKLRISKTVNFIDRP